MKNRLRNRLIAGASAAVLMLGLMYEGALAQETIEEGLYEEENLLEIAEDLGEDAGFIEDVIVEEASTEPSDVVDASDIENLIEDAEGDEEEEFLYEQASNITSMFGSATPIGPGQSYTVNPNVMVCYKLSTVSGQNYVFESSHIGDGHCDPYIRLYDESGQLIGEDDDNNGDLNFWYSLTGDGATVYVIPGFYGGTEEYTFSIGTGSIDVAMNAGQEYVESSSSTTYGFTAPQTAVYKISASLENQSYFRIIIHDGAVNFSQRLYYDEEEGENDENDFPYFITIEEGRCLQLKVHASGPAVHFQIDKTDKEDLDAYAYYGGNGSDPDEARIWQISPISQSAVLNQTITFKAGWYVPGDTAPQFTWEVNNIEQAEKSDTLTYTIDKTGEIEISVSIDGYHVSTEFYVDADAVCDHTFGAWMVESFATALTEGREARTCSRCGEKETIFIPKLTPFIQLNVSGKLPMKVKQKTSKVTAALQTGDYITSWTSSNTKVVSVSATGALTAQKKTGKATITAVTAAGARASFIVVVQKNAVKTSKISVAAKKLTLTKGQKFNLQTVVAPITNQDKLSYKVSKKGIVSVSKGVITAKKKGKTVITVQSGKKKVKVSVTVK